MAYTSVFDNILTMTMIFIVGVFVIYYTYNSYQSYKISKLDNDPRPLPVCPDYWESIGKGTCRNVHKIGDCRTGDSPNDTIDFSSNIFTNKVSGNYMKCKWAKECHAPWEGIDDMCT
jgi:hypothetical protein